MSGKPNAVLIASVNSNDHSENKLRKQRLMVSGAIEAWSPGGICHEQKSNLPDYCEQQKEYFVEALSIIDKHLKKYNRNVD